MKRHLRLIIACALLGSLGVSLFWPGRGCTLRLSDASGRKIAAIFLPEREFTLTYIHSVHRSPVFELYTVDESLNLVLRETRFDALGVGMPYDTEEGTLESGDGEFRLTGLNRKYRRINLMVTAVPGQSIIVGEQEYPLDGFAGPGSAITLQAQRSGLWSVSN